MKEILIDHIVSSIGGKIFQLRKQQNLSLSQLAEKAGVSVTTVHKLERSKMTPTVTVLMKIADALEEKVGYFLEATNGEFEFIENIEYTVQKKGKIVRNASGSTKIKYLAQRLRGGKMVALLTELKTGTKSGNKPQTHPGEEFVFCLQGEIKCEIDRKVFSLKKGDSLHFFSTLPHRWEVMGNGGTKNKNLWIVTPPPVGAITELWKWIPNGLLT